MARSEDPGQNPIKSQELSAFVLIVFERAAGEHRERGLVTSVTD